MVSFSIAVIGSGISGLSAAWLLSQRHRVTLLEAENRLGGHANTVDCATPEGMVPVDTGFIVYNPPAYPNLDALFAHLNVPTAPAAMGFALSLAGGRQEYSGGGPLHLIGGWRDAADPGHWRMIAGIARFFRTTEAAITAMGDETTLGQFLTAEGYGADFTDRHLLPMAGAIWSCDPQAMLAYPAKSFLRFFANHGLLKFTNRPQWRTVAGGSAGYVKRLAAASPMRILTSAAVHAVRRLNHGVEVTAAGGFREAFDHVVIGAHADDALAMLADADPVETRLLSQFPYVRNRAVLHRDPALMPRRRRLWSSWNVLQDQPGGPAAVTYWMNALQPLATAQDIFVTLNPGREPAAEAVIREFAYAHPHFTANAIRAQKELWALQGRRRTWFCGAYFGAGFHEDGLQSGLAAAEGLGGFARPWMVAGESGRIHVQPHMQQAAE